MGKNMSLGKFCKGLKERKNFLLVTHVNPEGDAIGSLIAMDSLLRRLGKRVTMISEDKFPERLYCLPHRQRWNVYSDVKNKRANFDALLVTDCPSLERIGSVIKLVPLGAAIFNIDHHISNSHFGTHNYVCPKAAASGEVVFDIFKKFGMPLNRDEATALYISLSTDTGSFKYSNTTVKSHKMAAELIQTGIDIDRINEELYATYSLNKIQLYSRLLRKVKTAFGSKVAWVAMSRSDLEASNATYEDTEGFIDFLKYLKEVKIAFFMSEMKNHNEVKVSFRAKGDYDVNEVAGAFGGGGHRKASGCTIKADLQKVEEKILQEIKKRFHFK